jgi:hypothetical protein
LRRRCCLWDGEVVLRLGASPGSQRRRPQADSVVIAAAPLALRRLGNLKARGVTTRLEASLQGRGPHFEAGGIPSRSALSSLLLLG